jgi:hypothetical protein
MDHGFDLTPLHMFSPLITFFFFDGIQKKLKFTIVHALTEFLDVTLCVHVFLCSEVGQVSSHSRRHGLSIPSRLLSQVCLWFIVSIQAVAQMECRRCYISQASTSSLQLQLAHIHSQRKTCCKPT